MIITFMSPLIDSSWGLEGVCVCVLYVRAPRCPTQNRASFLKMGDGKRRINRVAAVEHSEMLGFKKVRVKGKEAFLSSRLV